MSNLIIDLCQKVIKGGIDTCKTWGEGECTGIRCEQDHCPFAYGLLCNLGNENKRVEIANKYLFENGIEVEEDNKMQEKTFREVIADIKEGEIWDSGYKEIRLYNGEIMIVSKDSSFSMVFYDSTKYKLKRQLYSFEEAFKAFKEGKEIESIESNYKYSLEKDGFLYKPALQHSIIHCSIEDRIFSLDEILNKWYINN